jgi:hypothetical protein
MIIDWNNSTLKSMVKPVNTILVTLKDRSSKISEKDSEIKKLN